MWKNGIVTFGVESIKDDVKKPTRNFSEASSDYILAPLWFPARIADTEDVEVGWEEHTDPSSPLFTQISGLAANYSQHRFGINLEYTPTWALLVQWTISLAPTEAYRICSPYLNCSYCEYIYDYNYTFPSYYYCNFSSCDISNLNSTELQELEQYCSENYDFWHYYYLPENVSFLLKVSCDPMPCFECVSVKIVNV